MNSNDFDTVLVLVSEEFLSNPVPSTLIAVNDDANVATTNSKITVDLGPGNYIVIANSFSEFATGSYVLQTVTDSVDLSGTIKTVNGQDICAMVLGSGQFMVSAKDSAPLLPKWHYAYFMFQGNKASTFSSVSAAAMCCNT